MFKIIFALIFIGSGINHMVNADFYLRMMPPYIPEHELMVQLSGYAEIALGILLLIPQTTRIAALGLAALLIAVFPANVFMAMNPGLFSEFSPVMLWLRLPLQAVAIGWALRYRKVR